MSRFDDLARIFKALSDPNRLAILQLLRERCGPGCTLSDNKAGSTVSEIAAQFDIALSTVSHHIKELKNADLICCEKRGRWVCCSPNEDVLQQVEAFVKE